MNKYKLVIFDFDGTLADSYQWFSSSLNKAARKYHFREITSSELEKLRDYKTPEIMQYLGVSWWKVPFIARYMRNLMNQELASIQLFPGTKELIWRLRAQGVMVVIVSSNSQRNVSALLGVETLGQINHLECGVSMLGKKRKLQKVLGKFGVRPEEAIAIGDETRDIEAARSLQIPSGAVAWGYATLTALEGESPDFLFKEMDDLIRCLF